MSDILKQLTGFAEAAEQAAAHKAMMAQHKREELESFEGAAARSAAEARGWRQLAALVSGEVAPLTPRDITADDDVLGIRIGPLLLAPAGNDPADRRLYLATLRAIQDVLIHQVRLAVDSLNEQQRQRQADVPTTQWPAVQPPLGEMVDNEDTPTRWTAPNGQVWDLTIPYEDHAGDTWHWTGRYGGDEDREPLMSRDDQGLQDVPLSTVVRVDGPLQPVKGRTIVPPAAFVRDALTPPPDPYRAPEVTVLDAPAEQDGGQS